MPAAVGTNPCSSHPLYSAFSGVHPVSNLLSAYSFCGNIKSWSCPDIPTSWELKWWVRTFPEVQSPTCLAFALSTLVGRQQTVPVVAKSSGGDWWDVPDPGKLCCGTQVPWKSWRGIGMLLRAEEPLGLVISEHPCFGFAWVGWSMERGKAERRGSSCCLAIHWLRRGLTAAGSGGAPRTPAPQVSFVHWTWC